MKKLLTGICVLFCFVVLSSNASAEKISEVMLFSDSRSENEWNLIASIGDEYRILNDNEINVTLLGITTTGYLEDDSGWYGAWMYITPSPNPSVANGEFITVEYGNTTFNGRIASTGFPEGHNGIIQIPTTYNLRIISGGPKPLIGWSNNFNTEYPDYAPIDQYRIRVYDQDWNKLADHSIRSTDVNLSSPDQTFDFNKIDFSFEEGVDYIIRVEAREYTKFYNENNQEINPDLNEYADFLSVLNRNRIQIDYTVESKVELDLSYTNNTLNINIDVGTIEAVNANIWISYMNEMIPHIVGTRLPVIDPPRTYLLSIPNVPHLGNLGVLATLTTSNGIVCSDWETVETGEMEIDANQALDQLKNLLTDQ